MTAETSRGGVDPRFARSAGFWLHAYPRRWRVARGAEVLGLLADLAAPGARGVGARAAADLVRGGWATRWREHPPLSTWLLYRLLDRRIPAAYREWAADDIAGALAPVRRFLVTALVFAAIAPVMGAVGLSLSRESVAQVLVSLGAGYCVLWPGLHRRQAAHKHLEPGGGKQLAVGAFGERDGLRTRLEARSAARAGAWVLGVVAASGMVAATGPDGLRVAPVPGEVGVEVVAAPMGGLRVVVVGILLVAALAGAGGVRVAARRLRRLAATRLPDQPHRVLRPMTALGWIRCVTCSALVAGLGWLEASGVVAVGVTVWLGAVALVLLPGVVVAARALGSEGAPVLAGRDLWRVLLWGRPPLVDHPASAMVQLPRAIPPGPAVPPPGA